MAATDPSDAETYYNSSRTPDPVTNDAVRFAMEATDHTPSFRDRLWNAIAIPFIVLLIVFSIVIALFTANNTYVTRDNQNKLQVTQSQLQAQQQCLLSLVQKLSVEQKVRSDITSNDRDVTAALINKVFTTRSVADRLKAYAAYKKQIKLNEKERAKHPLPSFSSFAVCNKLAGGK